MYFALFCIDKPDSLALRLATRPAHLDYLKTLQGKLKLGGPLMTEDGSEPRGSLLVYEVERIEEARAIAANDPYAKAGLFQSVEIRAWNWLTGRPA